MSWQVPLTNVALTEEDVDSVLDVMRSGWLTMGPNIERLEAELAEYMRVPHAIAVSSGTAALQLACLAAGIGPGDEVVVPAMTFVATVSAVNHAGGTPVLCDSRGPHDPNLDPADVERCLTDRTKAVIAVHFGGYSADLEALQRLCDERGLVLIEDCAQAIGARTNVSSLLAGAVGALGCFSFFSKNQLSVGEGGLVTAQDEELASRVRLLRSHGLTTSSWDRHRGHGDSYDVVDFGFNFRLDEGRAALGRSRLRSLETEISERRRVAKRYRELLADVPGIEIPWSDEDVERSSHFAFVVLLPDRGARDDFRSALREHGVQTTWYPAVHSFSAYRSLARPGALDGADAVANRHAALPMSASLSDRELELVAAAVRSARSR